MATENGMFGPLGVSAIKKWHVWPLGRFNNEKMVRLASDPLAVRVDMVGGVSDTRYPDPDPVLPLSTCPLNWIWIPCRPPLQDYIHFIGWKGLDRAGGVGGDVRSGFILARQSET